MKKIYLIITIIILLFITSTTILYYQHKKQNKKELTVEATVISAGPNYLLITTNNNIDYIIKIQNTHYNVGDTIKLKLTNIKESQTPKEATAKEINIINESSKQEENTQSNLNIKENNNDKTKKEDNKVSETKKEEVVITYFETLDTELTNYNSNDETLTQKIKSKFVTCIDFIFYDKEISNITFKELTNNTKLKILEIMLSIDSKIDAKIPNYKETINTTYTNIKSKIIEKYLDITTNICKENESLCITAKENFKRLKDTFGITWNEIKKLITSGTTKLKEWYEIWRYN